jgi:hypothetical protein
MKESLILATKVADELKKNPYVRTDVVDAFIKDIQKELEKATKIYESVKA